MRCYSEREVKMMVVGKPQLVTNKEKSLREPEEPFDFVQFIADLEFEMKFEMLMRSIALRMPQA